MNNNYDYIIYTDGAYSNCVRWQCAMVSDIFKTMEKIDKGGIIVF